MEKESIAYFKIHQKNLLILTISGYKIIHISSDIWIIA